MLVISPNLVLSPFLIGIVILSVLCYTVLSEVRFKKDQYIYLLAVVGLLWIVVIIVVVLFVPARLSKLPLTLSFVLCRAIF